MINFIKQAVESVEGIKSFLFNTDYRNNFDLQNVEFPCCVLTPIMRKKYDLNNIIRESAELQLSVVDLAPFEYTGDDLYAINKRCSDLALQVIANLQVKSKLDKELTFEFILPSGDELISGVMCNLQVTMKQGSCIGAPSYVEVIVQPIKRESITSNGKHIITPSSGFNAMREVEVNVQVPQPNIEPTKQVTFNDNVVATITPSEGYDAIESVDVVVDVQPNLQDKQLTITENGMQTIVADEGFEGLSSVEVTTDVNTLQGLDFSSIFDQKQANEINQRYKDDIARSRDINESWNPNNKTLQIQYNNDIVFLNIDTSDVTNAYYGLRDNYFLKFANLDLSKCTDARGLCYQCLDLKKIKIQNPNSNIKSLHHAFYHCYDLEEIPNFDYSQVVTFTNTFQYCEKIKGDVVIDTRSATNIGNMCGYWKNANSLTLTNIENVTTAVNAFAANNTPIIRFGKWKQADVNLAQSSKLSAESIKYIIWHALNGDNTLGFENQGATSRILTLHATPYNSWETWKLTKPSVEDCEYLGVSEDEITKYRELTWEDIALNVKLITIAK